MIKVEFNILIDSNRVIAYDYSIKIRVELFIVGIKNKKPARFQLNQLQVNYLNRVFIEIFTIDV
jgi:hypothetical protein